MLEYVFDKTIYFLENMPKSVRKKKGQFFTSVETATYMAKMFPDIGLRIFPISFLEGDPVKSVLSLPQPKNLIKFISGLGTILNG